MHYQFYKMYHFQKRKEKVTKGFKCPPIDIICPSRMLRSSGNDLILARGYLIEDQEILQKKSAYEKKEPTKSEWTGHFQSTEMEVQNKSNAVKKREFSVKKKRSEIKYPARRNSPYVKNAKDFERILNLLKPVKGPTESVVMQIRRHNDQNRKNAENVILNRNQSFKAKMIKYSSRLGVDANTKIFIMNSKDNHIREVLLENGWIESIDQDSTFYHLKWVYMDQNSEYPKLQSGQLYNHFKNNQQLTNKKLLKKNIDRATCKPNFPLTYDLDRNEDMVEFKKHYTKFQCLNLLNLLDKFININFHLYYLRIHNNSNYFTNTKTQKTQTKQRKSIGLTEVQNNSMKHLLYGLMGWLCWNVEELGKIKYDVFEKYLIERGRVREILQLLKNAIEQEEIIKKYLWKDRFILVQIVKMQKRLLNLWSESYGLNNAWIIKPTGVSRGNGISIETDLHKLCTNKHGKIVQKYIEKPLLLQCGRKFDIRQWVMVRSFEPLEAYIFKYFYCRFSSQKYNNDAYTNLKKHLTNYSKHKDSFQKTMTEWNSILSEHELQSQMPHYYQNLKNQLKTNIVKTLKSCSQTIVQKKECFEVYGFDVVVDEGKKMWVLEVNMSPACDRRAEFIEQYLKDMAEGVLNLAEEKEIRHWEKLDPALSESWTPDHHQAASLIQRIWRQQHPQINTSRSNFSHFQHQQKLGQFIKNFTIGYNSH